MKFVNFLKEAYVMNVKGTWSERYSGVSDVFCNPTRKEMKELNPQVKWSDDPNKWVNKWFTEPLINSIRKDAGWGPLSEEYYASVRRRNDFYTIYKNPDSHDFRDLSKEMRKYGSAGKIRFIVDQEKQDVYIWDAHMATHDEIKKFIQRQGDNLGSLLVDDEASIEHGKIKCGNFASFVNDRPQYGWVSRYFQL